MSIMQVRWLMVLLVACLKPGVIDAGTDVFRFGMIERTFRTARPLNRDEFKTALFSKKLTAVLTAPDGSIWEQDGFWDGEGVWKFRFSPEIPGTWNFVTRSSDQGDAGLHGQSGSFTCREYRGRNPMWLHGPIKVSDDGFSFQHADGTPFFWLADTAWAGSLLSGADDWNVYLRDRVKKRFTAIQFMGTQNIACAGDAQGRVAFFRRDSDNISVDPWFFQRLDERVSAINEMGLLAAAAFTWASAWHTTGSQLNPGVALSDTNLAAFGRYFTARYGAYQVVWLFGGDADFRKPGAAERWRSLGREIFMPRPQRLVVVHPTSFQLLKPEFGTEPWVGFFGYQGCHSTGGRFVRWNTRGEPATDWKTPPVKPIINLEPLYEDHLNFDTLTHSTAREIRNASWWSVLVSPTAGLSYGAHGVWNWNTRPSPALHHEYELVGQTWRRAIDLPGSRQMGVLRDILDRVDWKRLRPEPGAVVIQPGESKQDLWVAFSATPDHRFAVAYFPGKCSATFDLSSLTARTRARWVDPVNGRERGTTFKTHDSLSQIDTPGLNAGGDTDWVLLFSP